MYSQPKNQNPDTSTHEYVNRSQTSNMPTIDFSEIERTQRPDVSKLNFTNTLPTNKSKPRLFNTIICPSFPNTEHTNNRFFRNRKLEYEHGRLYNLSDQNVRTMFKQKRKCGTNKSEPHLNKTHKTGTHQISCSQNARLQTLQTNERH